MIDHFGQLKHGIILNIWKIVISSKLKSLHSFSAKTTEWSKTNVKST